jgi:hypothetical protein
MKDTSKLFALALAGVFFTQSTFAIAATTARIIPTGTVTTMMDGKQADQFRSETVMPQDTLMLCDGTCLVQMHNLQVVAKDKAVFALAETPERWNMTIKSGQVDFAMGSQAKLIDFHTPHDTIRTQEIVLPASTESKVVRGSVIVTEGGTELVIHQGALRVSTLNGSQLVQPGRSITLAQASSAPSGPGDADSTGTAASNGWTTKKSLIVAGGVLAAVALVAAAGGGGGSDDAPQPLSRR